MNADRQHAGILQVGAWISALLLASNLGAAQAAPWAQPHTVSAGPYTLRASTIDSMLIPEQVAKENGIQRSATRGVLNVLVSQSRDSVNSNLQADVHATARDLTGRQRDIPMHEIVANGQVTYLGTYDFVRGEVVDFTIDAVPRGAKRKLSLRFRDRLWQSQ